MPAPAAAAVSPATALDALRHALDRVVERERPRDDPSLPTGLSELDTLLGGGLPRGRLSELQAPRGQGRTTLLRTLVAHTLSTGRWVAIVDAQRTLAPADWARLASPSSSGPGAIGTTPAPVRGALKTPDLETSRLAVIRPIDPAKAPWCADVLLRSGAYAMVILDGASTLSRSVILRLTRLAHDRQVVFLLAGDAETSTQTVGASVRLGISIESSTSVILAQKWRDRDSKFPKIRLVGKRLPERADPPESAPETPATTLAITVAKGGPPAITRIPYVITIPRRLGCHADVPDRRGVARQTPAPPAAVGNRLPTAGANPVAKSIGRTDRNPHARRAGESRYGRTGRR
jgi:recA bacterial DNA recombination protein